VDRAGLTPAYAVQVRHSADDAQQQATEQAFKDPQDMAREILRALPDVVEELPPGEVLPQVVAVLPADEVGGPSQGIAHVSHRCLSIDPQHHFRRVAERGGGCAHIDPSSDERVYCMATQSMRGKRRHTCGFICASQYHDAPDTKHNGM
jgi:hypothetical protein